MKGTLFADALSTVSDDGIDWKDIVVRLAEEHPDLVANAIAVQPALKKAAWMKQTRAEAFNGKVAAIRIMRKLTGAGLREAKQWVEQDRQCCDNGDFDYKHCSDVTNEFVFPEHA